MIPEMVRWLRSMDDASVATGSAIGFVHLNDIWFPLSCSVRRHCSVSFDAYRYALFILTCFVALDFRKSRDAKQLCDISVEIIIRWRYS